MGGRELEPFGRWGRGVSSSPSSPPGCTYDMPQSPSNTWPSVVTETFRSEDACYCPWIPPPRTGCSEHRGGHGGCWGGVSIARLRPRCPAENYLGALH